MESSITDTEEIISLFPDKASLYTLLEQELSSDEEQAIILPKTVVTDKEVYEMAKKCQDAALRESIGDFQRRIGQSLYQHYVQRGFPFDRSAG